MKTKMIDLDKKFTFRLTTPLGEYKETFTLREVGFDESQSRVDILHGLNQLEEDWMFNKVDVKWEFEED